MEKNTFKLTDIQREKLIERFKAFAANRKAAEPKKVNSEKAKAFIAKMREKLAVSQVTATPVEPQKIDPEKMKVFVAKMREKMLQANEQNKVSE
jgi:hypothetical protein